MNKIALRINVCADDWTAESAIKASNVQLRIYWNKVNLSNDNQVNE